MAGGSINSVQNGLLLDNTIPRVLRRDDQSGRMNDQLDFDGVLATDNYFSILCSDVDGFGMAGRHHQQFLEDEGRPVDQLIVFSLVGM